MTSSTSSNLVKVTDIKTDNDLITILIYFLTLTTHVHCKVILFDVWE